MSQKSRKQKIAVVVAAALAVLVSVLLLNTFRMGTPQTVGTPFAFQPDSDKLTRQMREAIRLTTISYGRDKPVSADALLAMHAFLEENFPLVHETLTREVIGGYSLLYTWPGKTDEKAVIFLGHLDVVPVIPGTEADWHQPPFSGNIADGYIWGRGSIDNKVNVIGLLAAAEYMLAAGLTPERTIYFAFGHDEEQGGLDGARAMAAVLESRNVQAAFLVDEGGLISRGALPGLDVPMAVIAPAEKGIVTLELSVTGAGGHSSMPPLQTSIGVLAQAIARLEAEQFPRDFSHTQDFLEAVADELPFISRVMMKNLWLFKPFVLASLKDDRQGNAGMRTTTAVTMIEGGVKANVLPITAEAKVNFRILPGETPETVKARVEQVIDDHRVAVHYDSSGQKGMAPSPISPLEGFGWEQLTGAIRDTAAPQRLVIAPRLLVAATDTRHYRALTPNHYRFTYVEMDIEDLAGIHGTNERISVSTLSDAVRFYYRMMSRL